MPEQERRSGLNLDIRGLFQDLGRAFNPPTRWSSGNQSGGGTPLADGTGVPGLFNNGRQAPRPREGASVDGPTYPAGAPYGSGPQSRKATGKKKCKKGWYQCWLDSLPADARGFLEPAIFGVIESRAINAGNLGGMSGSRAPRSSSGGRMITRQNPMDFSKPRNVRQGGFVDTTGIVKAAKVVPATLLESYGPSAQPRRVAIGQIVTADEVNLPGALDEVQVTAQRVGTAMPGLDDLDEVRVTGKYIVGPEGSDSWYEHYYPDGRPVATYPADSGSRSAPATRRTGGSTRAVPTSAPGTGKTGSAAKVARAVVGKIVLPLDSLLLDAIGHARKRSPTLGTVRSTVGAVAPGLGRQMQPGYANPFRLAGYPGAIKVKSATATDDCRCDEKKERKPRAPRAECWKGSYVETSRGLRKTRRERIPC